MAQVYFQPAAADAGFFHFRRLSLGANVYWFEEPDGVTMVDTGFPFAGPLVLRALGGRPLRRILLTHFHPDHSGSAAFLQRMTGASVHVHSRDFDFVAGTRWIDEEPGWRVTRGMLKLLRALKVSRTAPPERLEAFEEGQRFGEFEVLHTPGHTPGSSSFWNAARGVLFCGDNLVPVPFGLMVGVPWWTLDAAAQRRSLERYRALPVSWLLCGHGQPYRGKPEAGQLGGK